MKATKLPSGNYRCLVYVGEDEKGKKIRKSFTAPTKKLAEQQAYEYIAENKLFSNDTLYDKIEEHINLNTNIHSIQNIRKNKGMLKKLNEEFPDILAKPVHMLNNNDLKYIVNELSKERSAKTVKNYYGLIHSSIAEFSSVKASLPKSVKKIKHIPLKAEIEAILTSAEGTQLYVPILLGSYCMMREGEILALTKRDYNPKTKKLVINKIYVLDEKNKWIIQEHTKNYLEREITLPDRVCDAINKYGFSDIPNPHAMYCRYRRLLDKLGMDYTFHSLRHFGASYFHSLNIPLSYTQKYGGWQDIDTLLKIYQHTLSDVEDDIFNRVNESF